MATISSAGVLVTILSASAAASAEEVDFATMDRLDGESKIGTSATSAPASSPARSRSPASW